MADAMETDVDRATYEELAQLEMEFDDIDTEIMSKQYILSQPTYAKRAALINRIPNFWALVLELAPPEIDQYIQPSDSQVFATALKNINVTRFEVPEKVPATSKNLADFGEPRSVAISFEFNENEWFENKIIEKKFWYRRANDGYIGLVSEPVKVNWKKGKDLTDGLLDGAVALWEQQKKAGVEWDAAKGKGAPAFEPLKKKVEEATEGSLSFFTWFGYRGRYIGQAESKAATKKAEEKRERIKRGEKLEEDKDEEDDDSDDLDMPELDTEICPDGDDIAIAIAEDLWPSAIRYFTDAQEAEDMESADFEDDDEDDEDEDEDEEDEDMEDVSDARNLAKAAQKKGRISKTR